MPVQGDQRFSGPRMKIASKQVTSPSTSSVSKRGTPQPLAPAFASGPRSATSSIPVSSTQMPVPITRHSTQVIDVEQAAEATAAECLDRLIADYGSGSDDADASEKSPEVIDK